MEKTFDKCVICSDDMPEERKFTCSPLCYAIWVVDKDRARYRDKKHPREHSIKSYTLRNKLKRAQNASTGKYRRTCDYCGFEFVGASSKQYFCTPQCSILGRKNGTWSDSARRVPSMPKMPWDKGD